MKFFVPVFLGGFISFSLFALMAALVATDEIYLEPAEEVPEITIVSEPAEFKIVKEKHILEPPPKPPQRPNGLTGIDNESNIQFTLPNEVDIPSFNVPNAEIDTNFTMNYLEDSDAIPVYRALPNYPKEAAHLDVDGWVTLRFSIDRFGYVEDIELIDSLPNHIFDQAAIDVLARWKYKPKILNGKTVKQENLSVRIDFTKNH